MFNEFLTKLVVSKADKTMGILCGLTSRICREVAPGDRQALLAMITIVGSQAKLESIRHGWRPGDDICGTVWADLIGLAYEKDAEEYVHFGVRFHLSGFNASIKRGDREDNVFRAELLLTQHMILLEVKDPQPIAYFSKIIAEFFDEYIGSTHEVELFDDVSRAFAKEMMVISESHDFNRCLLFLTSIFQFAQNSQGRGRDRFFSTISASCSILCQENASARRWVIGEAIPKAMSSLIAEQPPGPFQKQACKAFIECLLIGKHYGLLMPAEEARQEVRQHLHALPEVDNMVNRIVGL
jgi:ankyrin repeat domain-containing protein 50